MARKKTVLLEISAVSIGTPGVQRALARAAEVLRAGGTVAFPTETVYGLGANALDRQAVEGIFRAKQRPAWDPLIVHVSDAAMLHQVVAEIPDRAQKLMDAFWPGPLTLLLPKTDAIPAAVTAGRALVGVRLPSHTVAAALIAAAGVPVAAPSANRFGHTSPTTAQHVLDDLNGRIDMLLDAGPTVCGIESTVVEVREKSAIVYRPGAVSVEELEAVAGPVAVYHPPANESGKLRESSPVESLPSPGVGIRHYAPRARVVLLETDGIPEAEQRTQWIRAIREHSATRSRVGLMLPEGWPLPEGFAGNSYSWGDWRNDRELAQRLFSGLRALDATGAELILCPLPPDGGLGAALRDRLRKAARDR